MFIYSSLMYNIFYNNRSSCSKIYTPHSNPNNDKCNLNCNNDEPINNTIISNLNIIQQFTLNYIINNNLFKVYNCVYTYKYNRLVLLKNKNKSFGFFEINVPEFTKTTDNLYIMLNVLIDNNYSTNINILNENGIINNFDLLTKKYFVESKYINGNTSSITKKYTISFSDDACVIEDFIIYFLGVLSATNETIIDNSDKTDDIDVDKTENNIITFQEQEEEYDKKYIYNNCFETKDKLLYYNLKNPTILMNNGLWCSIKNYKNIFSIRPAVPFFFDTSNDYYIQLEYYITKGGCIELVGYNDKNITSNPITSKVSNNNGIIIKKLDKLETPFFYYAICGKTCEDVVLKNLQIFYFVKKEEECCNGGGGATPLDCNSIICNEDGIIVNGSITVT